jgi:hypothetical protein
MEPEILARGKRFHDLVQEEWLSEANHGKPHREYTLPQPIVGIARRSRLDLLVDELSDFVSIIEIKSTDWDAVKPANRKKLLGSHRRQVWRYIDQYRARLLERHPGSRMDVCPGMIYPSAPQTPDLRELVEEYLNGWAIQVVWFDE